MRAGAHEQAPGDLTERAQEVDDLHLLKRLYAVNMSRLAVAGMLATLVFPTAALAQSDLQGVWTNGTLTPFERPPALGTKAFFTPEEAAVEERQATERRNSRTRRPGDVGSDNEAFVDTGTSSCPRVRRRSSSIRQMDGFRSAPRPRSSATST